MHWSERIPPNPYPVAERDDPTLEHAMRMERAGIIDRAVNSLTPIQQDVIRSRYGIGREGGETYREIGERWNLGVERMRQVEKTALNLLRYRIRAATEEEEK